MLYAIRYGEISIKGRNRIEFERQLISNIQIQTGAKSIKRLRGRILVETENPAFDRIFGIVSYSPCHEVEESIEAFKEAALKE